MFPQIVAIVGGFPAIGALFYAVKGLRPLRAGTADPGAVAVDKSYVQKSSYYHSGLIGIFLRTLAIEQFPTIIIFVILYLKYRGKFGWKAILYYTIGAIIFLLVIFNEIVPNVWCEPKHLLSFFG
ncbi:hypothetical protein OAJ57_05135 [Alphaproteobacteria bacterium]|nr:hypothetical protein [Alphaproteobacteria bacterium]